MRDLTILMCVHSRDELHDTLFGKALQSLAFQTDPNFDVLVVLNDCHGPTRAKALEYAQHLNLAIVEKPVKDGLASAKNFGLSFIQADYVMFLDADDEYAIDKVAVQRAVMRASPDIDFCFTQAKDIHQDGRVTDNCFSLRQYETHEQIAARLPVENVLCHGSACIKRSALEYLQGYPTHSLWIGQEDYVLWKMAMAVGFKFYNIPQRLYYYRLGTSVPR
jgi:glycosyltransferase involved in cell wall biosynthesis